MMKLTGTLVAGLSTTTSAAWFGRSPAVCADPPPVSPRTPAAAADSMWPRKSRRVMTDIARSRRRKPPYRTPVSRRRRSLKRLGLLVGTAVLHHEAHPPEGSDVGGRIALHGNHVGQE